MSEVHIDGDNATVSPGRDIVASMVEEFKQELKGLLDQGVVHMTIDLGGVEMMDSMGLGVLIAAHNSLKKKESQLTLTNISEDIRKLLKNMRLDQHFHII